MFNIPYRKVLNCLCLCYLSILLLRTFVERDKFKVGQVSVNSEVVKVCYFNVSDNKLYRHLCKKLRLNFKTPYIVCHHDTAKDQFISKIVESGQVWEVETAKLIKTLLVSFKNAIFLDVGANIGIHALMAAALGKQVWAVEPLDMNLNLIHQSSLRSNTTKNLKLIKNAIGKRREEVDMEIGNLNIGGSHVMTQNETSISQIEHVHSVLFSDILDEIAASVNNETKRHKIKLIVKMDIETFECNAILGSTGALNHSRIFIPVFLMEWHFYNSALGTYSVNCPGDQVVKVTDVFTSSGYLPFMYENANMFSSRYRRLNPSNSIFWPHIDVIWVHVSVIGRDTFSFTRKTFEIIVKQAKHSNIV